MGMEQPQIESLNKSRLRAIYYRKIGDNWAPTQLLPADSLSISHYLSKGFKAKPPDGEPQQGSISCPYCEFEAKNALGLRTHLNKHVNKEILRKEE